MDATKNIHDENNLTQQMDTIGEKSYFRSFHMVKGMTKLQILWELSKIKNFPKLGPDSSLPSCHSRKELLLKYFAFSIT